MYIVSFLIVVTFPFFQHLTNAIKPASSNYHSNVTTTVFWIGESQSADNGNIANSSSAWDENWQENFGGVDNPDKRNGYLPAGFTPKENVFYFALPYNDINEQSNRKPTAKACANLNDKKLKNYSWCKNTWIEIKYKDKTAYAQWEDVGPFLEDDYKYVFGTTPPANKEGAAAGLDVSPAVRDYLKMGGLDKTSWRFISVQDVPIGPWTTTVTSSKGNSLN